MSLSTFRTYCRAGTEDIDVQIGWPIKASGEGEDWSCSYRIVGLGSEAIKVAVGIDPLQAMLLALTYISTTIYFSEEFASGKIVWEAGSTKSDLGLPIAENVRDQIAALRSLVDEV